MERNGKKIEEQETVKSKFPKREEYIQSLKDYNSSSFDPFVIVKAPKVEANSNVTMTEKYAPSNNVGRCFNF